MAQLAESKAREKAATAREEAAVARAEEERRQKEEKRRQKEETEARADEERRQKEEAEARAEAERREKVETAARLAETEEKFKLLTRAKEAWRQRAGRAKKAAERPQGVTVDDVHTIKSHDSDLV